MSEIATKNYWNLIDISPRSYIHYNLPIYIYIITYEYSFLGVIFMSIFYPLYRDMNTYKKHYLR